MDKNIQTLKKGLDWHPCPQMSMLNNVCVTCNAVGFVSLVHPSQPLEEENKFEIWGAWGIKLSMVWIFCESTVSYFFHHQPSFAFFRTDEAGDPRDPFDLGDWLLYSTSEVLGTEAMLLPMCWTSNLQALTWGTPTMVSQRRTHSWAELSWPHKRAKCQTKNGFEKKKANAPEKSPEQRHPLVSLSYFQNFEFLSLLNPTFQKKLHTCFFFWDLSVHEEKE